MPTKLECEPEIITWHLRGPYAITVGESLHFQDDANDRSPVKTIAELVVEQIRGLAGESKLRMQLRKI